ncbi:helix-turn-helix transcriptional regulator [Kordiimonas lipolytica]|uniref:Helix-turn-helix transcriptional regulator n=2 Tax=Kordiimonas lipolytica TaxID=1662421 RepID=A0ABV8UFU5_9PROT
MGDTLRTTQRLMRSMEYYFPHLEVVVGENNEKRYRFPNGIFHKLIAFSLDELTAMETAAQKIELMDHEDDAKLVRSAIRKVQALMNPDDRNRIAPDLESILRAEGLIASPGPKRAIPSEHVSVLREAIKGGNVCEIYYTKRDGTKRCEQLHPYGFLYGHRHYLVANNPARRTTPIRKIVLSSIAKVTPTDHLFEMPSDFDLQAYSHQSFGVFFDKVYDVEWVFSEAAAAIAGDFIFHPEQASKLNEDGTLTVRFSASGLQEMAWHLLKWVYRAV